MEMHTSSGPRPLHGVRVLLGLFILTQLAYLFVINFFGIAIEVQDKLPEKPKALARAIAPDWPGKDGHLHDGMDLMYQAAKRYGMVTGQSQSWSLFAPDVGKQCVFPALVLRWDEEPRSATALAHHVAPIATGPGWQGVTLLAVSQLRPMPTQTPEEVEVPGAVAPLLAGADPIQAAVLLAAVKSEPGSMPYASVQLNSENEPADVTRFFRFGKFRLRRFEGSIALTMRVYPDETLADARKRWYDRIRDAMRDYGVNYLALMRMRLEQYRQAHPDQPPPKQAYLVMRRYVIVEPEKAPPHLEGPYITTIGRWQLTQPATRDYLPIERYNPTTGLFEPTPNAYPPED